MNISIIKNGFGSFCDSSANMLMPGALTSNFESGLSDRTVISNAVHEISATSCRELLFTSGLLN